MKLHRLIEVWFSSQRGRECISAKNMNDAGQICKSLSLKGYTGICVDVTFSNADGDLEESKSRWYSYKNGKLKKI